MASWAMKRVKISNHKTQISRKHQVPSSKTDTAVPRALFELFDIGISLGFGFCDLELREAPLAGKSAVGYADIGRC
jgi:hypothetical protein